VKITQTKIELTPLHQFLAPSLFKGRFQPINWEDLGFTPSIRTQSTRSGAAGSILWYSTEYQKKHKTMNFLIKHGKNWQNSDNLWQNEYRQRE
jgi:hypothetical protein